MKLLVVLINYRTAEMTLRALEFVLPELDRIAGGGRVAVVDNDSGDGSAERIAQVLSEKGWTDRVELIQTSHNGGFSYGVNAGARPALASQDPPDYVYLLNSDAFVDPGALACLVEFLDTHPQAGIAGSQIYGTDGALHETAFQFHSLAGEFESAIGIGLVTSLLRRWRVSGTVPTKTTRIDWLAGASMLIRADVFRQIGLFDDGFFLYFEETDFCLRAARAGWTTWYVPESRVEHIGGASTGWKDATKPRPPFWFQGRRHYFAKNHGALYLFVTNVVYLIGMSIGRIKAFLTGRPYPRPPHFYRDFVRFNFISPPEHPCPPDSRMS
jgi:hypothetical protein